MDSDWNSMEKFRSLDTSLWTYKNSIKFFHSINPIIHFEKKNITGANETWLVGMQIRITVCYLAFILFFLLYTCSFIDYSIFVLVFSILLYRIARKELIWIVYEQSNINRKKNVVCGFVTCVMCMNVLLSLHC